MAGAKSQPEHVCIVQVGADGHLLRPDFAALPSDHSTLSTRVNLIRNYCRFNGLAVSLTKLSSSQ